MVTTLAAKQSKQISSGLGSLRLPGEPGTIYELAFIHRSYAFEHDSDEHNERLEFLGDAILGAVVTDLIYNSYPDLTEGEMARLRASVVNTHALADLARELGLGEHMLLGKGEESSGGRDKASLLANSFEAVVGALYQDRGIDEVTRWLTPFFSERVGRSVAARARYDAKTALQETSVREAGELPSYRVASSGPDHEKRFVAHVYVNEKLYGTGSGRSKKEAEQKAAIEALEHFETDPTSGGGDARAS